MAEWKREFQYLLDRKILSRDELGYLFGQIKSVVERSMGSYIYNLVAKLTNNKYGPTDPPCGGFSEPAWADALQEYIDQLQAENERLKELLKLAYRNWLEDPDVAWAELGEKLCDGLCESMGDKDYQEWMQALKGNQR